MWVFLLGVVAGVGLTIGLLRLLLLYCDWIGWEVRVIERVSFLRRFP